jgi:ribosomal protein S4
MARYTGPKSKIASKFREAIYGPDKALERKNYPPGQHGLSKKRGKQSEYAIQLMEKQKAKYIYGVLEKQFENLFGKAHRKHGITGENLLKFLEARLDNTVYRLGIAGSRRAARQLVSHKHVLVNGDIVNIPSQKSLNITPTIYVDITKLPSIISKIYTAIKTSLQSSTANNKTLIILNAIAEIKNQLDQLKGNLSVDGNLKVENVPFEFKEKISF